jgi:hypothetical protein
MRTYDTLGSIAQLTFGNVADNIRALCMKKIGHSFSLKATGGFSFSHFRSTLNH